MTKRSLAIFSAITAILVVLALVTYRGGGPSGAPEPGALFFPDLSAQLDDVREVRITYRGQTFSVRRGEEGWTVPGKYDYPANEETVVQTLRALAELREFEQKTGNPDRYGELQVEDPEGEEADSKLVALLNGDGEVLAQMIIGKANTTNAILGRELVYVRRPGEEQAWLAVGNPSVPSDEGDWARRRIMDVDAERMRRYVLTRADGEQVRVSRPDHNEVSGWRIENLPAGREQKSVAVVAGPSSAIDNLNFRDVRPAAQVDFDANPAGSAEFRTFDGVVVTATLAREGEGDDAVVWVRFEASYDENAAWDGEVPEGSKLLTPEQARQQVQEINARVGAWAYQLVQTPQRFLLFDMDRLLEPLPENQQNQNQGQNQGQTQGQTQQNQQQNEQ
jgi:hypothetical protein